MIPLAVPNLCGREREYLNKCIDTTFVSSVGEFVNKFEDMVAKSTGSDMAVATSAGTTGLHAALTAVGVKRDELVIIPSFTFIASANAVAHCGAELWLMDISESDWCLDPQMVEKMLREETERRSSGIYHKSSGKRVAAIMPVYTLGNIPDMERFREIADEYNLPLVVDAACAIGATYKGRPLALLADLSVLSFNGNKTVTCGGGGAVVCGGTKQAKEWCEKVHHLTTTARVWPDYDFDEVGFNYRMTNIQAAVGCAQMEKLDEFVEKKGYIHRYYEKKLKDYRYKGMETYSFPVTAGGTSWFSGVLLSKDCGIDDVRAIADILKKNDIEGKTFWKPIHLQKMYTNSLKSDLRVSDSIWQRVVTLPSGTGITDDEMGRVVDTLMDMKD